jgi:hypothetical protein
LRPPWLVVVGYEVGGERPLFRVCRPRIAPALLARVLEQVVRGAKLVPAKPRAGTRVRPSRYPVVIRWYFAETHDAPEPAKAHRLYARPVSLGEALRRVQKKARLGLQFGKGMVVNPKRQEGDHAARGGRRRSWYE